MGNVAGKKKRKTGKGKGEDHVVSFSSRSYLQVELPREILEDLERPRTGPATAVKDPAKEMYEKLKALDQPAVMVPKPWSEMDQILSQIKSSAVTAVASPRTPRFPAPKKAKDKVAEEPAANPTEFIDMGELMDGLDEDPRQSVSREKQNEELNIDPLEFIKTKPFNPRKVKSLESTLSFSTIHTVKELDGGGSSSKTVSKPETVENVLKRRTSPRRRSHELSSPAGLSNELSRRSNDLSRRSSEMMRRSTEIERRSNEFQRRSSEQPRSLETRRSADFTATRPYTEMSVSRAESVRHLAFSG